jgi:aromatic-amino-acid transaminase
MDFLIASRHERPGDDPIFTLNAQAKERKARGEDIVNATIGSLLHDDGRLAVMPTVVEALDGVPAEVGAAYAPIAGRGDFRQAVIDDLLGPYGLADAGVCVATPGGSGALRMAMDDFLEPTQRLLTSSFFWGPYGTLAAESGRGLDTFNMFDDEGRFDVASLDEHLSAQLSSQGRALVIVNSPCHNPTGYSLDASEWDSVATVLEKHAKSGPITLLLDIAYAYYAEAGLDAAMAAAKRLVESVQILFAWSASKSFAQYGLRVGSLVAVVPDAAERKRVDNALTYSCRGLWSNCNARGQAGIAKILSSPELNERVAGERAELVAMLGRRVAHWNELAGSTNINYPRYRGGFFTTVFTDESVSQAAQLRERGIFVVPMKGAMRVAMCSVNNEQIDRIVSALLEVL